MKVLVAMDSFKGSLSSQEAGRAVREGILEALPHGEVRLSTLADGGEGTVEALCGEGYGRIEAVTVQGPLGSPVWAKYGILPQGTAVIEIAEAAGLTLIPMEERNPLYTTTYGVGELILDAIDKGCRAFLIGLGGSGTNDGGVGMLTALGWRFTDPKGEPIAPGAGGLKNLCRIDHSRIREEVGQCSFRIACDVSNPLLGENGCSAVFAPQKGASTEDVLHMDHWLEGYSKLVKEHLPTADPHYPGAGAAGGLGFAFATFLRGTLEPGAGIITEICGLENKIAESDIVITGEGCLDGQTAMGKGPIHIARLGRRYGKKVIAFAGCLGPQAENCLAEGVDEYYGVLPSYMSKEDGMKGENAYLNVKNAVSRYFSAKL